MVRRMLDGLLLERRTGEGLPGLALRRPWGVSLIKTSPEDMDEDMEPDGERTRMTA